MKELFKHLCLALICTSAAGLPSQHADESSEKHVEQYEYIVVGSGAGGGLLASRLALAGHTVLLFDAGHDVGNISSVQIPAKSGAVAEDPELAWNFYIRQYDNDTLAHASDKAVWQTANGSQYVGNQPPPGASYTVRYFSFTSLKRESNILQGVLYPRVGALVVAPITTL